MHGNTISVERVIKASPGEVFALITSLTDAELYDAEQIARLYASRWRVETLIEILKIQIRGTHATFRSKTPAMVRQELYALLCCYQMTDELQRAAVRVIARRLNPTGKLSVHVNALFPYGTGIRLE